MDHPGISCGYLFPNPGISFDYGYFKSALRQLASDGKTNHSSADDDDVQFVSHLGSSKDSVPQRNLSRGMVIESLHFLHPRPAHRLSIHRTDRRLPDSIFRKHESLYRLATHLEPY